MPFRVAPEKPPKSEPPPKKGAHEDSEWWRRKKIEIAWKIAHIPKAPQPAQTGSPGRSTPRENGQAVREATISAADGTVPIVYGGARVGGRIFFVSSYAGSLILGVAFSEGPVNSIAAGNVTVDGTALTTCASNGWLSYDLHDGAANQAVSSILALAGYTQAHPGLCYAGLRIYGKAPWQALPSILAYVQGAKVFDPRTSTTVFSDNPALVARDAIVRFSAGLVSAALDVDFDDSGSGTSVNNAADYYDETVDGEKRYTLNLAVVSDGNLRSWLSQIQGHCGLWIYPDQGVFAFAPDKVLSSPLALTDAHIRDVVIRRKNRGDVPTRLRLTWTNPSKDFIDDTAIAETAETAAGTEDPIEGDFNCPGINSLKMANRHALYLLRRENFSNLIIEGIVSPLAERLRRGDYVTITTRSTPVGAPPSYRLDAQGALVTDLQPAGNGEFQARFEEYDANAYSTATYATDSPPSTGLPDPNDPPDPVIYSGGTPGGDAIDLFSDTVDGSKRDFSYGYFVLEYQFDTDYPFFTQLRIRWNANYNGSETFETLDAASELRYDLGGNLPSVNAGFYRIRTPILKGMSERVINMITGDVTFIGVYTYNLRAVAALVSTTGVHSPGVVVLNQQETTALSSDSVYPLDPPKGYLAKVRTQTSNYTLDDTDNVLLVDASGGAVVITLPTASLYPRIWYRIKKVDSSTNTVTINRSSTNTIDGATSVVLRKKGQAVDLVAPDTGGSDWALL